MRVSAFPRWNNSVVESRTNAIDCATSDQFRQAVLNQEELYENSVRPFVKRCLEGCSGSIITYGARGSGKSYTLGTLDPQQLGLDLPCTEAAGVLPRCTQQLYESLGHGASVEITCVEVQGDDVVDLLDQRAGDSTLGRLPAADAPTGGGNGVWGSPSHGMVPAAQGSLARRPIATAASGVASGPRRKPLTLVVARSVAEALLVLKRAVANRQAFITGSRHSSSRTHAVFQLRWRNPAGPVYGVSGAVEAVVRGAPQALGGGLVQRAYSAPPRASLPTVPAGCSTVAAAGGQLSTGWGAGPVCTLTLVDTCNFCPLLPPKEGSAVKRSLLALSRVLSALQRRHALTLRESKLTRMLEGAVDQVLVLACLAGSGDEPTMQLVKMLHQGASRDCALRRSRRASSTDSTRISDVWDADSHASVCTVTSAKLAGAARGVSAVPPRGPNAVSTKCSPAGKGTGSILGPGPGRTIFYSPVSPPGRGYGVGYGIRPVVASRTECPHHHSLGAVGVSVDGGESGNASSGGGTGTDAEAAAAQPLSSSSLDVSSLSPPAYRRGVVDSGEAVALLRATALASTTKTARPAPLNIDANEDAAGGLVSPVGGCAGVGSSDGGVDGKRLPLSSGGGASGARRAGSFIPSPPGLSAGVQLPRRLSPGLDCSKRKPPAVTARTPPGPEARRSQGFSLHSGKWASPPPVPSRDTSFPVVPCVLARHDGVSVASPHRFSPTPPATAASTDSAGSPAAMERPPRASPASKPASRAASAPLASAAGSASPAAERKWGGREAAATPPRTGSGTRNGGFTSPFSTASREPVRRASVIATSTVDSPEQAGAGFSGSPASACSTPARKGSGIPGRPPVRSPQPSTHSPLAAPGGPSPAPRPSHRPSALSTSPAPAGAYVSLAAVRPTRLASARYGSAGVSHDSFPDGAAVATSTVSIAALMADLPANLPTASLAPKASNLQRPVAAAAAGALVGVLSRGDSTAVTSKRSISSGMRWPSPLLRARRAEWLTDMRRPRSALMRPVSEMPDAAGADGASPRRLRGAFRCAALGNPTLSAQYKDLLLDFEAFKARERTPRQHRSASGGAASSTTPAPSRPGGNPSPDHRAPAGATGSPAASEFMALVTAQKSGATPSSALSGAGTPGLSCAPSPRQQGAAATGAVAVPAGSPAVSTGAPAASSPASISTPHSAMAGPGSCGRPAGAFSRAHSPVADDGMLSLTAAAAAAAAASPRTPVSTSTMPSGRPRPGVSRVAGTTASPRLPRSPENTTMQVSPVTVLDMSRLFAAGGSRTPVATGTPSALSGCSRVSAGSVCAAAAALALASGGSERYRRWAEEDLDSDCISDVAAADDPDAVHGQGGAGPDPCGGTDSDSDNLLGPGRLGHLGLMLDIGGDVTALRSSISRLGDSGRASPSVPAAFAVATAAATPSPLRYAAAAAATSRARLNASPSEGSPDGQTDEELPAVSFFIHQFMSQAEVREKDGGAPGQQRSPVATGEARCAAALPAAAVAADIVSRDLSGAPSAARRHLVYCCTSDYSVQEAAKHVGASKDAPPPHQAEREQRLQRRRSRESQEVAGRSDGAAEVAVNELRLPYILEDRGSVESGVLRGSCTPSALDHEAPGLVHRAQPAQGWRQGRVPDSTQAPNVVACRVARAARDRAEGGALALPSQSSISLRQLLEKQEQLLKQQQRTGRRAVGLAPAPAPVGGAQRLGQGRLGGIGVPSATLALAQLAHVRPNHFDLDEQSNVLVEVDSASESDVATGATRRTYVSALQGSRAASTLPTTVTSPSRPSAPLLELPSVTQTPSPMKASQSPSQVRSQASVVRARIAALEAALSPMAAGSPAPEDTASPPPPRLVHTWAHGGGGHSPAAAALAAASTAVAAARQGGAVDGARQVSVPVRSSPSPSGAAAVVAVADTGRRAVSGSGPAPLFQAPPRGGDPGHVRHPSDGAIGAGAGGSPASRRHCVGNSAMAAGGTASPPRSLPPPPPPAPPPVPPPAQVTSSVDSDGAAHRPAPVPPPVPPPPQQPQQLLHHQPQAPTQQPLPLRGSGNVAAAWRAAAAMSTSSSSSVRSCFRSSSGQQQQQHHQNMIGSDATAVATVVALNRTSGSCCDDKQQQQQLALAQMSGQAVATGSASASATVRLSGGAERLHSMWSSENSTMSAAAAASGGGITTAAAATITVAAAPQLPPSPPAAPNPLALRSMSAVPAPQPLQHVPPLVLPAQPPTPAIDSGSAVPQAPLPAKAKSARYERYFPFTARLRACASHRTPRTPGPAVAANSGRAAVLALGDVAEQPPEAPPPPAYPPGFVTWATKLFSGGKKNKQAS